MMMAASRAINKKEDVVSINPVVIKRKVGRPPAAKLPEPDIVPFPTIDLTKISNLPTARKNYDVGDSKSRMDQALEIVVKSKGKHAKRTSEIYNVSRKSLVKRYNAAIVALDVGPTGNSIKEI